MTEGEASGRVRSRAITLLILLAVTLLNVWVIHRRLNSTDSRMREDLLLQTRLVAQTIRPSWIADLSASSGDLSKTSYQRLKTHLELSRTLYPNSRFIYLAGIHKSGEIFFYADSEPPESEKYSAPGQSYPEASATFRRVFVSRTAESEGPIPDRWGNWISGFVPIIEPNSGELIAVLGMDIGAKNWAATKWQSARMLIAVTGIGELLAVLGCMLLFDFYQNRAQQKSPTARYSEIALIVLAGATLTMGWVDATRQKQRHRLWNSFTQMTLWELNGVSRGLSRIGALQLEGLHRFFRGSDFVDLDEFRDYCSFLSSDPASHIWLWTPLFPRSPSGELIEVSRAYGFPVEKIRPLAPHFSAPWAAPIAYTEALENRVENSLSGFDLATNPHLARAIALALQSDQPTAAESTALTPNLSGVVIFRAVKTKDSPNAPSGLVAVILNMPELLRASLGNMRREIPLHLNLLQLGTNGDAAVLARFFHDSGAAAPGSLDDFTLSAPIEVFGQTYALVSRPSAAFPIAPYTDSIRRTGFIGALMTALWAVLVWTTRQRQRALEELVRERTAALQGIESSYRDLLNSVKLAVYIMNRKGEFLDVNTGAEEMYGYAHGEMIGLTPERIAAPNLNNAEEIAAFIARAWAGQPQHFEFWGRSKDGRIFPKEVWLTLGQYAGAPAVIAMAVDITARKQAEEDRERMTTQLAQLQKIESIGRLAGGVAHDFNNVLQIILGNVALALEEAPPGTPLHECLAEIEKSAKRSSALTRQLLAFASRQPIRPRVLDLNETVPEMLKMLRRLIGEHIVVTWSPGVGLWRVKIDPNQLDQVLTNLVLNSRDAIEGNIGRIAIETANATLAGREARGLLPGPPGDYVSLTISDNGHGMTAETRAHIFEPFYTTKGVERGTGLGLATVYGIVKQNKGIIHVRSEVGEGTIIQISLPRADDAPPETAPQPASTVAPLGRGETIMLVEDEPAILRMETQALEKLGYRVLPFGNPLDAAKAAEQHAGEIHMLLTDVVLPDINGKQLEARVRSMRPDIVCLFMSGYTADAIATRGILAENERLIQKPFSMEALSAKIRELLDEADRQPPSRATG